MRCSRLALLCVLALLLALGPACKRKDPENIATTVTQKLGELQTRLQDLRPAGATANVADDKAKAPWESFKLTDREIFKPFEATELSEEKAVNAEYKVQLKGIVVIGEPRAILAIDNVAHVVKAGDKIMELVVQEVTENGLVLQRSYKLLQLAVGAEQQEI